jgi:hypothetical protein
LEINLKGFTMTTYTWNVSQTDYETATGFIITAHFQCTAVDGDFTALTYSTSSWPNGVSVTPYANVTMAKVLEWIWDNGVDKDAIETSLAKQLDALKNPVTSTGTPWVVAPALIPAQSRIR